MDPNIKDTTTRGFDTLLERSLSRTQSLVQEAESILLRLGNNRAAMSRPLPLPVGQTSLNAKSQPSMDSMPKPAGSDSDSEVPPPNRWNSSELTDAEFRGLTPIFKSRGFLVNADMRKLFELSVVKASTRLRALVNSDYLLHQGMGSAARYFRGAKWPVRENEYERDEGQHEMPRLRLATSSDLMALALFATSPDVVRLTLPAYEPTAEANQALEVNALAAKLRSPSTLLMLAEDEESRIAGYVHTVIRRKVGEATTCFIRALVFGPQQSPTLAHRLLRAAMNIAADSQVSGIKVQAGVDDSRLRTMLEHADFHVTAVEMTFKKSQ